MHKATWLTTCLLLTFICKSNAATENSEILDSILLPELPAAEQTPLVSPEISSVPTPIISTEVRVKDAEEVRAKDAEKKNYDINKTLEEVKKLYDQKKFTEALSLLDQAEKKSPDNYDVKITKAKVLSWKKDYAKAQVVLNQLLEINPDNDDVFLAQAYLYYYQNKFTQAKRSFEKILAHNPKYSDAKVGLQKVNQVISAQKKPPKSIVAEKQPRAAAGLEKTDLWRIDVGSEYSTLYRTTLSDWNQEFAQLTRFFNDGKTALYTNINRYYQFNELDTQYGIGINQRFKPWLNGYFYAIDTPYANFRPIWGVAGGGEIRFAHSARGFNAWVMADVQDYTYTDGTSYNFNPALRTEYKDKWDLIVRNINQFRGSNTQSGWLVQTHVALHPRFRVNMGVAYAPDIEDLITYRVKSFFTGFAVDLTKSLAFNFEYIRDDYVGAYLRHGFNGTFSIKF